MWEAQLCECGGCGQWNIPLGQGFRSGLAGGDFWGDLLSEKLFVCPGDWG